MTICITKDMEFFKNPYVLVTIVVVLVFEGFILLPKVLNSLRKK